MKTIFTLILLAFVFTSSQSQSFDLSLKLEKGKEYKQVSESKSSIYQEINGLEMGIVMKQTGTMTFLVTDCTESGYKMDAKLEKLSISMETPQGSMEVTSEKNDSNDVLSLIFSTIKHQPFEVEMSKKGKITEVRNLEDLWVAAINQFEELSDMQKKDIEAQVMNAFGADAVKGNIEMFTAVYPDKPVNKGDTWPITTQIESGMAAEMKTVYELVDMTSDYALITGTSIIETADKDAYIESNGMPMRFDLKGLMNSEIKVDRITGWIVEAKINQEMKGDIYIKENSDMPEGMKIPMTMINEMTIKN